MVNKIMIYAHLLEKISRCQAAKNKMARINTVRTAVITVMLPRAIDVRLSKFFE
jgi:hypothetical protein